METNNTTGDVIYKWEVREYNSFWLSGLKNETMHDEFSRNFLTKIYPEHSFNDIWIDNRIWGIVQISIPCLGLSICECPVSCCPQYVKGLYPLALPIPISFTSF